MFRLVITTCVMALGILPLAAQVNVTEQRHDLMHVQGDYTYGILNSMVRGRTPYDQAKVDEAFAKLAETAAKLPPLFPASSKGQVASHGKYFTRDEAWENKADFDDHIGKLKAIIVELRPQVRSLNDLKVAYPKLNRTCNDCHRLYRGRRR